MPTREDLFSEIPQPLQFSIKKKAPAPVTKPTISTGTIHGPNSIKKAQAPKVNKKKMTSSLEDDFAPEHFMMDPMNNAANSQYISRMLSRTLFQ